MWFAVSGFIGMGSLSTLSLASHLDWPMLGLAQGPGGVCISQPRQISHQGSWEVCHLFPPIGPSQIVPVSLQGSTMFLTEGSCCETTHARGYYGTWPRWAVSVSGLLTHPEPFPPAHSHSHQNKHADTQTQSYNLLF